MPLLVGMPAAPGQALGPAWLRHSPNGDVLLTTQSRSAATATATTASSSANPSTTGQSVSFTATVWARGTSRG